MEFHITNHQYKSSVLPVRTLAAPLLWFRIIYIYIYLFIYYYYCYHDHDFNYYYLLWLFINIIYYYWLLEGNKKYVTNTTWMHMFEVFRMFFQCFAWFWAGKQLRKYLGQGTVKVKFFRDVPVPAKHSLVVVLGFPLGIFCMFTCFGPSESRTRPRNRWHVCWRYVVICGDVIIKTTMKNIPSSTCWCVIKVNQRHWNIRVYDIWCTLGHGMIITGTTHGENYWDGLWWLV